MSLLTALRENMTSMGLMWASGGWGWRKEEVCICGLKLSPSSYLLQSHHDVHLSTGSLYKLRDSNLCLLSVL